MGKRLLVHVEGETEEEFVRTVLEPHLFQYGFLSVTARKLGNSRQRRKRGGITSWPSARTDILRHIKQDKGAYFTTMVDFYALPAGKDGWPGRSAATGKSIHDAALIIEQAILSDLASENGFEARRFIPNVVIHEFEAFLFSDCDKFAEAVNAPYLAAQLRSILAQFNSPEDINDSVKTAPSKRILQLLPSYEKVLYGTIIAADIGLRTIRDVCKVFDSWLMRLETLPDLSP